eukprot:306071-Hanusia_phi.AAC.1
MIRFIQFLYVNESSRISQDLKDRLAIDLEANGDGGGIVEDDDVPTVGFLKSVLNGDNVTIYPIDFDQLRAEHFMKWVHFLLIENPDLSYGTFSSHRSALFNLFRRHGKVMSIDLAREMASHFKGLKRTLTSRDGVDNGKVTHGKDPLPFDLY